MDKIFPTRVKPGQDPAPTFVRLADVGDVTLHLVCLTFVVHLPSDYDFVVNLLKARTKPLTRDASTILQQNSFDWLKSFRSNRVEKSLESALLTSG